MQDIGERAQEDLARRRLRRIAHAIGIGFAIFTCLAIFIVSGDAELLYAVLAGAGLGVGVWLAALLYAEHIYLAR